MNRKIKIKILIFIVLTSFSINSFSSIENNNKKYQLKLDIMIDFYSKKLKRLKENNEELSESKLIIENEIKELNIKKNEIENREFLVKNINKNLKAITQARLINSLDETTKETALKTLKNLGGKSYFVEFDTNKNGKALLIKYTVKENDTLKKILLNTYDKEEEPSWSEIAERIDILLKINKSIIKMNYIYLDQKIYIPIFKNK